MQQSSLPSEQSRARTPALGVRIRALAWAIGALTPIPEEARVFYAHQRLAQQRSTIMTAINAAVAFR